MSNITLVMVFYDKHETPELPGVINRFLKRNGHLPIGFDLSPIFGGEKVWYRDCLAGAFNCLDASGLVIAIVDGTLPEKRQELIIIVKPEDAHWHVFPCGAGSLKVYDIESKISGAVN